MSALLGPLPAAGDDPWSSIYGGPLRLASDARRFDVSPAGHAWRASQHRELLARQSR